MRYYIVTAKCGHVGKKFYIPIDFAVMAGSASEAASKARQIPRVKHDHKDAILSVREIDRFEFAELAFVNEYDPYLQCTSKKEQMQDYDGIYTRIREEASDDESERKRLPIKPVFEGKKLIRNVRRYAREQMFAYDLATV